MSHKRLSIFRHLYSGRDQINYITNRSSSSTYDSHEEVVLKKRGSIALIGINRPDKKNTLNYSTVVKLNDILTTVEHDESFKAAVLYGERGNLCSGYDLTELESDPAMIDKINSVGLTDRFSRIPLVAAVSGFAQGPGFELALWCDFRIVEESAVLGGFAKQLGLPMSEQSANKFVSILGFNKAMDWILTGRTVKGKEALECGIANRLVAVGTGLGQGFSFASGLANMPVSCLRADRASIYLASQKISDKYREIITQERDILVQQALQDFKDKKYRSEDGDVRRRK